jgi:hypothetical protein
VVAASMATLGAAVAWLNRGQDQYSGLYGRYRNLAQYFQGSGEPQLFTYPSWGYPWLLSVLPSPEHTSVMLQVALGIAVLLLVRREMNRLGLGRGLVDALCILAVPWYALASLELADPWSASLTVIGAVLLARAIRRGGLDLAAASGVVFGLSLNVRSELLALLPAAMLVALAIRPSRIRSDARIWATASVVAVGLLLPWGWFRMHHGEPFGLTTTNSGMVLYNSLGFQGNAWGIVASDALRKQEARELLGPEADPASPEASAWFRERALAAIAERPAEYGRKVFHNFVATLKFGFYGVEVEPLLSDDGRQRYEVLKEQLKLLAGAKANPVDIEAFRRAGLWQDEFSLRSVPVELWAVAAGPIVNSMLSCVYLLALLGSLGWVVFAERRRLDDPFVRVSIGFAVATWGLLCLLQYEPRQANSLYVFGLPLVGIGAQGVWQRWRRTSVSPRTGIGAGSTTAASDRTTNERAATRWRCRSCSSRSPTALASRPAPATRAGPD